ncbi:MAG TPA: FeoB-associated Cys-rich membrane protein [Opitutaceae bacterium]|nr:FeoB-associated Cys-rich membrane protein [Opitutaceae bacterium]
MSSPFQTVAALILVVLAATWLVWRAFAKKKNPGCGGDCGCPTNELKTKLKP